MKALHVILKVIGNVAVVKSESENRSWCHKMEDILNEMNRTGFSTDDNGTFYVTCKKENIDIVCQRMGVSFSQ